MCRGRGARCQVDIGLDRCVAAQVSWSGGGGGAGIPEAEKEWRERVTCLWKGLE